LEPEKVPEVLKSKINFKVFALIIAGSIGFQTFIYFAAELPDFNIEENLAFVSMSLPLVVSVVSFFIAHKYGLSQVFGKSYLFLALAFFCFFLAEVAYYVYDEILEIEPYPSIADVFFFALYVFAAIHILINFRFFKTKTLTAHKLLFIAIPLAIFSAYSFMSLEEIGEANFDFYYGIVFVAGAAVTLSLAALGALVFRGGLLGIVWAILLIGLLGFAIGDVWYYYLELYGEYDLHHPVNLFWYAGNWVIIYALYKHSRAI
ncbi:MAG TPA: histidine kinase, partial [Nitrosopumilaceae archaeon]|nr:histidine kinase [Nitrosopumilaceae archaeon]